ncbi:unnamed protein product [Staurois parvus]|uniref:Uncharacterized protein n=1 Tax=Staurois parvus TaxID=386267 RepID=A0ABN9FZT9_9NEOB|nr:unnamed protein product [Staurois parvus]
MPLASATSMPHQCLLISAHQCCLSEPITAASLGTSVKEKNHLFTKFYNRN